MKTAIKTKKSSRKSINDLTSTISPDAEYAFGTGLAVNAAKASSGILLNSMIQGLDTIFSQGHQNADGNIFNVPQEGQIMATGGVIGGDPVATKPIILPKTTIDFSNPAANSMVDPTNQQGYLNSMAGQWGLPTFKGGNDITGYRYDLTPLPDKSTHDPVTFQTTIPGYNQRVTPTPSAIKPSAGSNFAMGGTVQIKSSHKGLFTKWAKDHGMSVVDAASHVMGNKGKYSKHVVKMANFAKNFAALGDSNLQPMNDPQQQGQNIPVEVEGGEVAQTPNGQLGQFKGPSHEDGGIPANLPQGTKIYSDRLAVDGKTMQARKLSRERSIAKLNNMVDKNPTDILNKNTYNRMKTRADMEEQQDLMMQDAASQIYQKTPHLQDAESGFQTPMGNQQEQYQQQQGIGQVQPAGVPRQFATGTGTGGVDPLVPYDDSNDLLNPLPISAAQGVKKNTDMPYSSGDNLGFLGNAISGALPLATTIANRAGDKPNINAFQNFGKNAIAANDTGMGFLNVVKDEALKNAGLNATAQRERNRNSSTSVGTSRALDLATSGQEGISENNIYSQYAQQMAGMYNEKSKLSNQQDLYTDTGAQTAAKEDRMDRDSYYTNLAQNFGNIGHVVQQTGKEMNEHDYNNQVLSIMPYLNKYGLGFTYDENGHISGMSKIK